MASRAGIPNKNKQALINLLQKKYPGYHPVMEMARIAHETDDEQLAAKMHSEVAQYVEPKRKAIDVDVTGGMTVTLNTSDTGL